MSCVCVALGLKSCCMHSSVHLSLRCALEAVSTLPLLSPTFPLLFPLIFSLPCPILGLTVAVLRPQNHNTGTRVGFPDTCSPPRLSLGEPCIACVEGKEGENPPHHPFLPIFLPPSTSLPLLSCPPLPFLIPLSPHLPHCFLLLFSLRGTCLLPCSFHLHVQL